MFFKKIKSLGVKKAFFMSYFLLLIISIIAGLIVFFVSFFNGLNTINLEANRVITDFSTHIDTTIYKMKKLQDEIFKDLKNNTNIYDYSEGLFYVKISKVRQKLSYYVAENNNYVNNYFLVIPEKNIIVNRNGIYNIEQFYTKYLKNDNFTYKQAEAFIEKSYDEEFLMLPDIGNNGKDFSIAYVQTLSYELIDVKGILVTYPNKNILSSNIFNIDNLNWKTDNHTIILSDENIDLTTEMLNNMSKLTVNKLMFNNKSFNYISNISNSSKWKYVICLSTNNFYRYTNKSIIYSIIVLLFFIVIGLFLLSFFSKKIYSPIKDIISIIPRSDKSSINNEYRYIKDYIENAKNDNMMLSKEVSKNKESTDTLLLQAVVQGRIGRRSIKEKTKFFSDKNMKYCVSLFDIKGHEKIFNDDCDDEDKLDTALYIIQNIVNDLFRDKVEIESLTLNDNLIVVSATKEFAYDELKTFIVTKCDMVRQLIHDEFNLEFAVCTGGLETGDYAVFNSYKQAIQAHEYSILFEIERCIFFDEIYTDNMTYNYNYDFDKEEKIIQLIQSGEYEHAEKIIKDVVNSCSKVDYISVYMAKAILFDLSMTIIKILHSLKNILGEEFILDYQYMLNEIHKAKNISESTIIILDVVKNICSTIKLNDEKFKYDCIKDIIEYIEKNFADPELNVQQIADKFYFSMTHITRKFKNQIGCTIIEYIQMYRIKQAEKLLRDNTISIKEVATKVGIEDCNRFIRTFKKYNEITPGKYQENIMK